MTLLLAVLAGSAMAEPAGPVSAGDPFPATAVSDAGGEAVKLDAPGQVTVVNVWATWCGPCRVELPLLDALHGRIAGDGAAVVAVSVDDGMARPLALAKRLDLDLRVLYDDGGALAAALSPEKLPTTYVVDADGTIRSVHAGALDEAGIAALEAEVRALSVAGEGATGAVAGDAGAAVADEDAPAAPEPP